MRNIPTGLGMAAAALLAAALVPAAAQAQSSTPRPEPRAGQNGGDTGDRMVCMRVEFSNSRVTRRICRTRSEWEARGELENDPR